MSSILADQSYMSPNARGGWKLRGLMSKAVHRSPNNLWRTNSIYNLCIQVLTEPSFILPYELLCTLLIYAAPYLAILHS
jgi:hypothetical protein